MVREHPPETRGRQGRPQEPVTQGSQQIVRLLGALRHPNIVRRRPLELQRMGPDVRRLAHTEACVPNSSANPWARTHDLWRGVGHRLGASALRLASVEHVLERGGGGVQHPTICVSKVAQCNQVWQCKLLFFGGGARAHTAVGYRSRILQFVVESIALAHTPKVGGGGGLCSQSLCNGSYNPPGRQHWTV